MTVDIKNTLKRGQSLGNHALAEESSSLHGFTESSPSVGLRDILVWVPGPTKLKFRGGLKQGQGITSELQKHVLYIAIGDDQKYTSSIGPTPSSLSYEEIVRTIRKNVKPLLQNQADKFMGAFADLNSRLSSVSRQVSENENKIGSNFHEISNLKQQVANLSSTQAALVTKDDDLENGSSVIIGLEVHFSNKGRLTTELCIGSNYSSHTRLSIKCTCEDTKCSDFFYLSSTMDQLEKTPASGNSEFWFKIRSFAKKHCAPSVEERKKYNQEFVVSTSFHGLHNLIDRRNTGIRGQIRRVLWMTVVLVSVIAASSQVFTRCANYFNWPTTTSVTIQYVDNIEFPSVTFCNLNRFQTRAVNNLSVAFFMWNIVSTVLHFSNMEKDIQQEVLDFLQLHHNFSIKDFTRNYGFYLNNRTLLKCDFYGYTCYPEDFVHVFTEYGNCYTFNHNNSLLNKRISSSGRGLSVMFDIKQDEFTDEPMLGFVDAGIIFVIHSPKVPPSFDGLGLRSPVGMHAHASITLFKTIIQEHPWGDCNPDLMLAYHDVYSTYGCLQECKSSYVQHKCGCLPFLLPGIGKECDIQEFYNCVLPALNQIDKNELCSAGTYNSTCPVPCEETDYPATLSYSTFPSEKAADYLSIKLGKSPTYVRDNLVYIDIKYHELNYKINKQQKALTSDELLSNVGGQLGLFCGASMITVIEVLEYLLTNFFWICAFLILKVPNLSQWRYTREQQ
ncbi:acid-sensing ion channel 5 [Pseudophryne corroboree]|uniref:acid-sensing ion channel 5 n=1 Tax=Pseudophryne corroboree TaxID=495146 RepID=UPI00308194B0